MVRGAVRQTDSGEHSYEQLNGKAACADMEERRWFLVVNSGTAWRGPCPEKGLTASMRGLAVSEVAVCRRITVEDCARWYLHSPGPSTYRFKGTLKFVKDLRDKGSAMNVCQHRQTAAVGSRNGLNAQC